MNRDTVERVKREVIGMRTQAALRKIASEGLLGEMLIMDGIQFAVSTDHRPDRIRLEVIDDIVRNAFVG